jgi:pimeloyl-ACP methyl ester carboxylesterase
LVVHLAGCASLPSDRQQVGGADISYAILGSGQPTLVFEAGLGDGRNSWTPIVAGLAGHATLFLYDRPGYGEGPFADTSFDTDQDGRRTGPEIARHLHETLRTAGLRPPYILVGHSIGGLYSLSFAELYPDETAALVLVDGRPPAFTHQCLQQGLGLCELPAAMRLLMAPHMRAEIDGTGETSAFVADPAQLGDLPLSILVSTRPGPGMSREFHALWMQEQRRFAEAAHNADLVEAAGAGHYIHHDRPDFVISEIIRMIGVLSDGARRSPD